MSEVGQKFKAAREKRGISIQEVGLSLKINPRVIAAIENGERDSLPARTFLRGFVKSYAQFLRMDVKSIMDEFASEYGMDGSTTMLNRTMPSTPEESTPSAASSSPVETPETPALPPQRSLAESPGIAKDNIANESGFPLGKVVLGVILFAAVVFLAKMVDKYQKERALPEESQTENAMNDGDPGSSPTAPTGADSTATPADPLSAITAVTAASSPTAPPAVASTPNPTATPSPTPTATPTPSPSPTPTPKPSPSPTPTPKASPSPSPTSAVGDALTRPVEVILEANKSVRVRYDLGNGQWTTLDMNEGGIHTFRSKNPVSLDIADGGAVTLIVNGRDRGKPGPSGQPVQLRLRE